MTLPAFASEHHAVAPGCVAVAARRPVLSIDMFCAYGAQQQTRRTPLLRSTERRGCSWICHCSLMLVHTIYISAAVLLSEGLKVKLKPPLIVWCYRLQWFVPLSNSPAMNPTDCKVDGVVEATATACLVFSNSLTKINEFTEAYWLGQTWLKQDIGGKPVSNASAWTYRRTGNSKAIGLCLQPHLYRMRVGV